MTTLPSTLRSSRRLGSEAAAEVPPQLQRVLAALPPAVQGVLPSERVLVVARGGVDGLLSDLHSLAPREPGAWTAIGSIYIKLKQYPDAVDAFQHAVDLAPHNGNFWNNLASAYSEEKDFLRSLQTLERQAQTAGPYQDDVLWYNLGNGLSTIAASTRNGANSGKPPDQVLREAIYVYQQSLRKNPRYANAWNNLGIAHESLGATEEALNDYQRAASLGDSYGRKNYNDLQNRIAATRAQAAAGPRTGSTVPGWIAAKERAQFNWSHDYYLRNYTKGPQ